jgi:hypothetical protein
MFGTAATLEVTAGDVVPAGRPALTETDSATADPARITGTLNADSILIAPPMDEREVTTAP